MSKNIPMMTLMFCLVLALGLVMLSEDAHAQKGGAMGKDMAKKEGMDALGSKEFDQNRLPGTKEIAFAVASLLAAIAVIKWA